MNLRNILLSNYMWLTVLVSLSLFKTIKPTFGLVAQSG